MPSPSPLPRPLSAQVARLRWLLPLLALALALTQQLLAHFYWRPAPDPRLLLTEALLYGAAGPLFLWLALGRVQRRLETREVTERQVAGAHEERLRLNRQLEFLLRVNQRLAEAADEAELAELALQLPGEVAPVLGCALLRFDDRRQPLPVEFRGRLTPAERREWGRQLEGLEFRQRCAACPTREAGPGRHCPPLALAPLEGAGWTLCLPLARSGQEFGILSLYLAADAALPAAERGLLQAAAAEISIAFENVRLRSRELTALYEVNDAARQQVGLDRMLERILACTLEASETETGLLLLREPDGALRPVHVAGHWRSADGLTPVENLAVGACESGEPIAAHVELRGRGYTVLCAPMVTDSGCQGVIALGSTQPDNPLRRQARLLSAIAGQSGLLVENARLYRQWERRAILIERDRLGRDMHDGLAQTLGFLKMRSWQIANWLGCGEAERARAGLQEIAAGADEAYRNLREVIDDLRAQNEADLLAGLRRLVDTFQSRSGIPTELRAADCPNLPPASVVHLLRLTQEALNNVQKHARARRAWVDLSAGEGSFSLVIGDDGAGFPVADCAPESVPDGRHGLRTMRERADLLGAELQIWSQPGEGTRVTVVSDR